jgi:hypothetical protein
LSRNKKDPLPKRQGVEEKGGSEEEEGRVLY